ncbi:SgcJ/EcaC family oxidoreductase [Lignipirellula cremea]|uniref:DUF4440 domain-containing protein n=1 Tax=Lignipirellula cremea TaxID=2528010 RepID=A0A518DYX2_9BACT|nr:SgcJ/EcaC family oxidoreductase [Lignipirellula cremea]QDU97024.1 hypothetical protein Pla8534_48490 [Lignipirellula cremea]
MSHHFSRRVSRTLLPGILGVFLSGVWGCSLSLASTPATKTPAAKSEPAQKQPTKASAVKAQPTEAASEEGEIRAASAAFVVAFNKHDAKAIGAMFAEEGEYQSDTGLSFEGRAAIEKGYASYFSTHPQGKIRLMIDSIRLLSDSAAIEDGHSVVEPPPAGAPAISRYSVVHVKIAGKWLAASVRETRIETPSTWPHLSDLEWLIGDWTAEEHGVRIDSTCQWIANKSFVERSYTVTHPHGVKTTGKQIIGWNPQQGHLQSWDFSSDGGHAIGVWTQGENGWTAQMNGMTGDGVATGAIHTLTRLDDDAYVWQSVQRTLGGIVLSDTEEVVIKRQPASR